MDNQPTAMKFDVMDDVSPISVGMDIKQLSVTDNMSRPRKLTLIRHTDKKERTLQTYVNLDDQLCARLRLLIVPTISTNSAMLGEIQRPASIRPLKLVKRLHVLTHAHPDELMKNVEMPNGHLTNSSRHFYRYTPNVARVY